MLSNSDFMKTHDNNVIRHGTWLCENKVKQGTVVLLGGRTEFMEKYEEVIGELNHRGFDVFSFDWRGQGLSSRMLAERHKGFIDSYEDYIKDLDLFIKSIVKPKAISPLIILAHSMGGHIALRFIHDYPGTIDKAVLVSPMIDIVTFPFPGWFLRYLSLFMVKAGLQHAYALGSRDFVLSKEKFTGNRLTSDPERFMDDKNAISKNPDLALGGVTYGWLAATFKSIKILSTPGYAEKINIPVLIVGAGSDRIVSIRAQKTTCASIRGGKFTVIGDARHEILKEVDSIRSTFWCEFDRFTGIRMC